MSDTPSHLQEVQISEDNPIRDGLANLATGLGTAKDYLQATDHLVLVGNSTPEIDARRVKAEALLDGTFVEPPYDLFDV